MKNTSAFYVSNRLMDTTRIHQTILSLFLLLGFFFRSIVYGKFMILCTTNQLNFLTILERHRRKTQAGNSPNMMSQPEVGHKRNKERKGVTMVAVICWCEPFSLTCLKTWLFSQVDQTFISCTFWHHAEQVKISTLSWDKPMAKWNQWKEVDISCTSLNGCWDIVGMNLNAKKNVGISSVFVRLSLSIYKAKAIDIRHEYLWYLWNIQATRMIFLFCVRDTGENLTYFFRAWMLGYTPFACGFSKFRVFLFWLKGMFCWKWKLQLELQNGNCTGCIFILARLCAIFTGVSNYWLEMAFFFHSRMILLSRASLWETQAETFAFFDENGSRINNATILDKNMPLFWAR